MQPTKFNIHKVSELQTSSQLMTVSIPIYNNDMKIPISDNLEEKVNEATRSHLSVLAMMSFYLFLFAIKFSHPFDINTQEYYESLLLALFAAFSFIAFVVSTILMIVVGASFSRMQMAVLLISPSSFLFSSSNSIILVILYLGMIAFLSMGRSGNPKRSLV